MARTPRTHLSRGALALVVLLGACGNSGDEIAEETVVTTAAPDTTTTEAPTTTEATTTTTAPTTTAAPTTTVRATTTTVRPTTVTPTTARATTTTARPTTTTAAPTTVSTTSSTSSTTTTTTTGPAPSTTAGPSTTVVPAELVLDGTGLGVAEFGDPAEAVIAALIEVLGPPTDDTGWVDPFLIGTCESNELRRVSWGGLGATFGDNGTPGSRQFFTYSYGDVTDLAAEPVGLLTTTGIGIGTSVADLRAAYPGVVVNEGEEGLIESTWYVDETLGGFLTGGSDTDVVTVIYGGSFCG